MMKPEESVPIKLCGFRLPRDTCASCFAIVIKGTTVFACEPVSHPAPPCDVLDKLMKPDSSHFGITLLWMDDYKRVDRVQFPLAYHAITCSHWLHYEAQTLEGQCFGFSYECPRAHRA